MIQDLQGKRFIVFGVASEDSLAWAAARELADRGALVTLGYQKRFLSRVRQLVADEKFVEQWEECDVASEESVQAFYSKLTGTYDGLVHAVAFAPAEALGNPVTETTQEDFEKALTVSSFSLIRVTRHALPKLAPGSGIVTLTYLGAERVVPGYRIMGTAKAALESVVRELAASIGPVGYRVNAVSAGPVRTLAASGIPGFTRMLDWMEHAAPLRRNVTQREVARAVRFLASDDASAITGQTVYVDAGYNTVGVPADLDRVLIEPSTTPPDTPQ